jgi:hypothetical protein
MNKKSTLFILFLFLMGSLSAQDVEVPETQTPMIAKITASWCPFCGSWGWSFFDDIFDDNEDKAIFMSVHHSGDYSNETAMDLTTNFEVFGQPRFILDGEDQNVSSGNTSAKRTEVGTKVDEILDGYPSIQSGLDATFSGDQLRVDYTVELFENLSGDYQIAFYVLQKTFFAYQAGVGDNAEHKALLRKEMSGSSFGMPVFSGSASAGATFTGTLQSSLENYDPENLSVVAVIWEKVGNHYRFVNSNDDKNVQEKVTSGLVADLALDRSVQVFPNVVDQYFTTEIVLEDSVDKLTVDLLDAQGRKVMTVSDAPYVPGQHRIQTLRPVSTNPGNYYLRIQNGKNTAIKKLIFE